MAAQRVFTFNSPVDASKTIEMIENAVRCLGGKTKLKGNVLIAKWRRSVWENTRKFTFYIGTDAIRVTTKDWREYMGIKWERKCKGLFATWNAFVEVLLRSNPGVDFQLASGDFHIVSAKIMSDGIEETFSSTSKTNPSIGGALVGGALFGGVGAIIGGSRTKTKTTGSTNSVFSSSILVAVRYSNGLILEGDVVKDSSVYNNIMVGMCEVESHK